MMELHLMCLFESLWFWLTYSSCRGQNVELPVKTTWTLYTDKKTYSEGELVCELAGGHLASPDTDHKMQTLEHFLSVQPWLSGVSYGATIGLHNIENKVSNPRFWSDCTQAISSYTWTSPQSSSSGCCSKSSSSMYPISCSYKNEFICEQNGGVCPYEILPRKKAISTIQVAIATNTSSDSECQTLCNVRGINCWAVAREQTSGMCLVYNVTSPFYFDNGKNVIDDAGSSMFIKRCYTALLIRSDLGWLNFDSDWPSTRCSSNKNGRVYTLVGKARTAAEAKSHCENVGQVLASTKTEEDRIHIRDIVNVLNQSFSRWNPVWVDFSRNPLGEVIWVDGSVVNGNLTVLGNGTSQCGLLDWTSGHHYLDDCERTYSSLCVKTNVSCVYVKLENVFGADYTNLGSKNEIECQTVCDEIRQYNGSCFAYSYDPRSYPRSPFCYLHTVPTNSYYPKLTIDTAFTFYRWSCVYAVVEVANLLPIQSTTMPTSLLTTKLTTIVPISTEDATAATTFVSSMTTGRELLTEMLTSEEPSTSTAIAIGNSTVSTSTYTTATLSSSVPASTTLTSSTPSASTTPLTPLGGNITRKSNYMCACKCDSATPVPDSKEEIIKALTVVKNTTLKSRLLYTSVNDPRPSARSIGALAACVISVVFILVVLLDCVTLKR